MSELACEDCGLPYGGDDWLDVVLPDKQWALITGRDDGSGILCANCIVKRAARRGQFVAVKAVLLTGVTAE